MSLLVADMTHGQAVALILLFIFLIVFIIVDVYFVLFLHRRNKKLAQEAELLDDIENDDGTSTVLDE